MSKRIDDLKNLIEREEKCRAKHIESVVIKERFEGMPVWDGVVETFQLEGHQTAKRAYGWVTPPASKNEEPKSTIVLGLPPVNSASDAVKAATVAGFRQLKRMAERILDGGK